MTIANEYINVYNIKCEFGEFEYAPPSHVDCGPVVAVYISDDDRKRGKFLCKEHAERAERGGDGPVFWVKTQEILLQAVNFKEVLVYAPAALKERVKVIDYGPRIRWFHIFCGPLPVGCLGLLGHDTYTELKGIYVIPEMRRHGIGTHATEAAIALVEGPIEAAVLHPSWYHARGFKTLHINENGIAIVRWEQ